MPTASTGFAATPILIHSQYTHRRFALGRNLATSHRQVFLNFRVFETESPPTQLNTLLSLKSIGFLCSCGCCQVLFSSHFCCQCLSFSPSSCSLGGGRGRGREDIFQLRYRTCFRSSNVLCSSGNLPKEHQIRR